MRVSQKSDVATNTQVLSPMPAPIAFEYFLSLKAVGILTLLPVLNNAAGTRAS